MKGNHLSVGDKLFNKTQIVEEIVIIFISFAFEKQKRIRKKLKKLNNSIDFELSKSK